MEGVEEEVRVELHPQGVELGLGQLALELRGGQGALAEAALVLRGVGGGEDAPVAAGSRCGCQDRPAQPQPTSTARRKSR